MLQIWRISHDNLPIFDVFAPEMRLQIVLKGIRRQFAVFSDFGRHTLHDCKWWYILGHYGFGTHYGSVIHTNIPKHGTSVVNDHTVTNLGMTITRLLACPTKCNAFQDTHIVAYYGRFTNNNTTTHSKIQTVTQGTGWMTGIARGHGK